MWEVAPKNRAPSMRTKRSCGYSWVLMASVNLWLRLFGSGARTRTCGFEVRDRHRESDISTPMMMASSSARNRVAAIAALGRYCAQGAKNSTRTNRNIPGHVRELANLIERGVAMARGATLELALLPESLRSLSVCSAAPVSVHHVG